MSNSKRNQPTWLVTGTSSGIGLALAQHILKQKHNLISISRHPKPDSSLKSLTTTSTPGDSPSLHHVQIDLAASDPESIKSPIRTFLSSHPEISIDVLVNNAGSVRFGALETLSPSSIFETMNTNFYSPLWLTQVTLPCLRGVSSGHAKVVLNVSSTQGLAADPSEAAYDASKHALEGMSKVLAAEVAGFGIRVLVANLGSFRTGFAGKGATSTKQSNAAGTEKDEENVEVGPYGPDHPVAKRMAMVMKYSNIPNAARGDINKCATVLFDAVLQQGEVNETLEKQREWSVQRGDGRGRIERLVLGSDGIPKVNGVAEQLTMEVQSCQRLLTLVDAQDVS